MNLEAISNIWNIIVYSNTFNFIVFVAIIIFVARKANMGAAIAALQAKIIKIIDDAKKEHAEAKEKLLNAEKAVENLPKELEGLMQDATKSAEIISQKVLLEAQKQIESIEANAVKVIEAEEKLLVSQLTKNTSKTSVELAETHIKNTLDETPTLHEKYINESIDELDRLTF